MVVQSRHYTSQAKKDCLLMSDVIVISNNSAKGLPSKISQAIDKALQDSTISPELRSSLLSLQKIYQPGCSSQPPVVSYADFSHCNDHYESRHH